MSTPPKSLRAQRKERGWSVSQLEQLSGVPRIAIECAERGITGLLPFERARVDAALTGDREPPPRKKRGFAKMKKARRRELASKAGKAAHEQGRAHQFTTEEARAAGRIGGLKAAATRDMTALAKKGGAARAKQLKRRAEERPINQGESNDQEK